MSSDLLGLYFAYFAISFKNSIELYNSIQDNDGNSTNKLSKSKHYDRNVLNGYKEAYAEIDKKANQNENNILTPFSALQSIYKNGEFGGFENNWEEEKWPFCHNLGGEIGNKSYRYIGNGQDGFKKGFQFVFTSQGELVINDINGGYYGFLAVSRG